MYQIEPKKLSTNSNPTINRVSVQVSSVLFYGSESESNSIFFIEFAWGSDPNPTCLLLVDPIRLVRWHHWMCYMIYLFNSLLHKCCIRAMEERKKACKAEDCVWLPSHQPSLVS